MAGFPNPSDKNLDTTIVNGEAQIDLAMWQVSLLSNKYLQETFIGISYGIDNPIGTVFAGSNLLKTYSEREQLAEFEMQALQTAIANKNLLIASGTANAITLSSRIIDNTYQGGIYARNTQLPFKFRNGLELDFVATANNTGAVTISIPNFQGVSGSLNVVNQDLSALIANDIQAGYRYTIICDQTNNRFILKNRIASTFGKATGSDITIGTNDTTAITPFALKSVMTSSITNGTGWAKYSNGIIHNQLQTATINSGGSVTITFPVAFTSSTSYRCFVTLLGGVPNQNYTASINKISNTQAIIGHFASGGSSAVYEVFAIGT